MLLKTTLLTPHPQLRQAILRLIAARLPSGVTFGPFLMAAPPTGRFGGFRALHRHRGPAHPARRLEVQGLRQTSQILETGSAGHCRASDRLRLRLRGGGLLGERTSGQPEKLASSHRAAQGNRLPNRHLQFRQGYPARFPGHQLGTNTNKSNY